MKGTYAACLVIAVSPGTRRAWSRDGSGLLAAGRGGNLPPPRSACRTQRPPIAEGSSSTAIHASVCRDRHVRARQGALASCQFCTPCCLVAHLRTVALTARRLGLEPAQEMAEDTREARSASETGNTDQRSPRMETIKTVLRSEAAVVVGAITTALFYVFSDVLLSDLLPGL